MIKAIKGTKDILPIDMPIWYWIENIIKTKMNLYNYKEIRTPIFEETKLFSRGIGEATDIVSKEMYTFIDRSENSITLRPEMTASVVRSFIEHNLEQYNNLNKLFYIGPMFRQERPQAGRLRQFHQFGAEALGSNDPMVDAEMIVLAYSIIKEFGLSNIEVKINSLGVPESRENYKKVLKEYLADKKNNLSQESQLRYDLNILRLFDSKDEKDQEIMKDAPILFDYLDNESKEHFLTVKNILSTLKIPFVEDYKLVRGLDYYTNTTFEIISSSVGSQSALCGGGRYNLLIKQLEGKDTPGIGFAAGIERIILACTNEKCLPEFNNSPDLYIIKLDKDLSIKASEISNYFRINNIVTELDYLSRSVKAQMREANKLNANFTLFLGGEEYQRGNALIKNMSNGEQSELPLSNLELFIQKIKD